MTIKTMKELEEQFDKEELIWKRRLDSLVLEHEKNINSINDEMTIKEKLDQIDICMGICDRMAELDSKHKKFLLKWHRKVRRGLILNLLFHPIKGE